MRRLSLAILFLFLSILLIPSLAYLYALQGPGLRFKESNPVVAEGRQIALTVIDANGQPVSGVTFESDSPDIAVIDRTTGVLLGVQRGFATITASRGIDRVSTFITVVRVRIGGGLRVIGDIKEDAIGRLYISDPVGSVILRADGPEESVSIFAGSRGINGRRDGLRSEALFAGPTGLAIDNGPFGGVYVADTLNHSVRKIDFNDRVTTVLGTGVPGLNLNDVTPFEQATFKGLRSLATDIGGNLFIADTENHAIYFADFTRREVRLLAGQPGVSGKESGRGRTARFNRPTGIAVSPDGRAIAVADTGNNRVRLITRDGAVTTIGEREGEEFFFDEPRSVSFDNSGNIFVVERVDIKIIMGFGRVVSLLSSLAQLGFGQVAGLLVRGADTFLFTSQGVFVLTISGPEIFSLSRDNARLEGGEEIVISGKNFLPESLLVLGDRVVVDAQVVSAREIRFRVPPQNAPGNKTLLVRTRGGLAQSNFRIVSKPLSELADGEITTIAGGVLFLGDGGRAINASLMPRRIVLDRAGNLFIADSFNQRIRRVDFSTGVITTVAGSGTRGFRGDGGPAIIAGLNNPSGIAIDRVGNLFIADVENNRIRRVDINTGIITTVVGNGTAGFSGDGGPATVASLNDPQNVSLDMAGNLFITDTLNNRIRRVDARTGLITTVAGNGIKSFSGDNGPATNATINDPSAVALDEEGNLFIADSTNNRIRRVDVRGIITTVAGNGLNMFSGDGSPATGASLFFPEDIAIDGAGNLFIADSANNRIRRVDVRGIITTVAGNGSSIFSGDGGPAISSGLFFPEGIAIDGLGNLFIADMSNNRIRHVNSSTGIINTVAGNGTGSFTGDGGPAVNAGFSSPDSITVDRAGNLFIADSRSSLIRRVDVNTSTITTVAGNGLAGFSGDGGQATGAGLSAPTDVATDGVGNLYIADTFNNRIRRVDAQTGIIFTVVGNGTRGFSGDGGPALSASLNTPLGLAVDETGNLFIVDTNNLRVRRVDARSGIITTVAGNGRFEFSGDGGSATNAGLGFPTDVAIDVTGNLFIADFNNNRVRRVDARTGVITTVAGNGENGTGGDGGPATRAGLDSPVGVVLNRAGNLFISGFFNSRVRRVDARTGIITTVAGNGIEDYAGDGGPATRASLNLPRGLAIDPAGDLLIADSGNNAIRAVKGIAKEQVSQPAVMITDASFIKPNLSINGTGFGLSGVKVNVNGKDISSLIISQSDTQVTLKGNKKKLNLKKGPNQIVITAGSLISNTFILNLLY